MIKSRRLPAPAAAPATPLSPDFVPLLQVALTLLAAVYMLLIGGTFDASLRYRVQLLNTVLAGVLALGWLTVRLMRRERIASTGLEWPLAFFALSQWVSLMTSAQPRLSLEWVAAVTAWCASLFVLCDLLRTGWPRDAVINALLLLAGLVTVLGLAEVTAWYAGWLRLGRWPPLAFRLNGLLGHANLTAAFLNLLLPLVLVRAAAPQRWPARLALATLAAGMLVVLFFTSSRAGWLAAAVGLAALALLAALRTDRRAVLSSLRLRWRGLPVAARWLVGLLGLATVALAAWLLAAQSQHITHGPLFSSRQTFWMVAWRMFQTQPLTGAGPDLYTWFYTRWVAAPPQWFAPHAHSLPLQVLGGSGLLGASASGA
jgi:O-antigen ligase